MRVLHVYRTYFPDTQGGLEETIRQICFSTKKMGVESEIFTLSSSPDPSRIERPEGIVYRARENIEVASCSMGLGAWRLFRDRAREADVVHYHFPWPFADMLAHAVSPKCPQVATYHSDIVRQKILRRLYGPLMHRFLRRMDAIVATSEPYASSSPVLRLYRERVRVIPIGIDEKSYPEVSPILLEEVQRKFGYDFFLFIGVLRQYKGVQYLLDAARRGRFDIIIAGAGPMERKLHLKGKALGLTNVHFLGHVSDAMKVALLKACRALVLPSCQRSEAYGVSLLEGAMSGRALISTELRTGTSYINQHEVSGLVVPPADVKALRGAMDRLFSEPHQAEAFGLAARQRYLDLFRADAMGGRYMELYSRLIHMKGRGQHF